MPMQCHRGSSLCLLGSFSRKALPHNYGDRLMAMLKRTTDSDPKKKPGICYYHASYSCHTDPIILSSYIKATGRKTLSSGLPAKETLVSAKSNQTFIPESAKHIYLCDRASPKVFFNCGLSKSVMD